MGIQVRATQTGWEFTHANGGVDPDGNLYVPAGPVELTMTTGDVTHSLFIPEFGVERDIVPGRQTTTWFDSGEATSSFPASGGDQPAVHCGEFCGTTHATTRLHVIPADQYPAYMASLVGPPLECLEREDDDAIAACWGEVLYAERGCIGCHKTDGSTTAPGPNWGGMFGTVRSLEGGRHGRLRRRLRPRVHHHAFVRRSRRASALCPCLRATSKKHSSTPSLPSSAPSTSKGELHHDHRSQTTSVTSAARSRGP